MTSFHAFPPQCEWVTSAENFNDALDAFHVVPETFDFWMMAFTFRKQHKLDAFILSEISQRVMRRVHFGGNIDGLHHLTKRFFLPAIRLAARRPFMKNSLFAAETLELNFSETLTGRNIQKFLSLLASRSILHLKLHYFTKPNSWRKKK